MTRVLHAWLLGFIENKVGTVVDSQNGSVNGIAGKGGESCGAVMQVVVHA